MNSFIERFGCYFDIIGAVSLVLICIVIYMTVKAT